MGGVLFIAFCLVAIVGAPFLPTKKAYVEKALDMFALKPGETLLDLGSGDGRMLTAAALRKIHTVGYEINFFMYLYSLVATMRHRKYVRIIWGNYWNRQLPDADGIFVFLLQPYMKRLDSKLTRNYKGKRSPRLVSFVFTVPDKKPSRQQDGLYLYDYQ